MEKNVAQVFPQPYPSAPCDTFGCRNRASYFIGRPDGPLNLCMRVCDSCIGTICDSLAIDKLEPDKEEEAVAEEPEPKPVEVAKPSSPKPKPAVKKPAHKPNAKKR